MKDMIFLIFKRSKIVLGVVMVFLLSVQHVFPQDEKIDSLKLALKSEEEYDKKVEILFKLHESTKSNTPRQSIEYPREVIKLSEEVGNKGNISKAYQQIGISYVLLNEIDSALLFLDKGLSIAKVIDDKKKIATCVRTMGTAYWYKNNLPKAIELYTESLKIFEELGDEQQIATTVANLGTAYYVLGNFSSSIDYYLKALNLIDSTDYSWEFASYLNDVGTIYKEWGNRTKALDFFLRSLKVNELIDDKRQMAANIDNIGSVYLEDGNYSKALEYYQRGLQLERSIDNIYGMASAFLSISSVHILNGQVDSSLHNLSNALKCYNHVDDKLGLANTFSKYGEAYFLKGNYQRSVNYYNQSIEIAREIGDEKGLAYALGGVAASYCETGENDKALKALNESISLCIKGNYVNQLMANYQCQSKVYKIIGKSSKVIDALENYIEVRDTVLKIEKQKQASELLARFESEKKEDEIKLLNQQNELSQTQLAQQRAVTFTVAVLLLVTGLGIFLLFRRYREKQRVNFLLSNKNREIEEKQEKIEAQNEKLEVQAEKLRELDEIKSRFFTNISHEFRTPLTLIVGPTEQLIQQTSDSKFKSTLQLILRNAKNLLGLINQLLDISRIEKGVVKMNLAKGDLRKELSLICEMFSVQANSKGLALEFSAEDSDFYVYYDKEKIERILFNLISNAVKNTEKGKIQVKLTPGENPDYVKVVVSDTGKGIEKDKIPFIFDRFYMANDESAKVGSGIGLAFTRELIKVYKGNISVESAVGEGTTFTLEIPINTDLFGIGEYNIIDIKGQVTADIQSEIGNTEASVGDEHVSESKSNAQTILLVEDHEELRKFVGSNLSDSYNLLEAENGRIGIELALAKLPDLIITDVMMPEVDGIELAKTLKANENTSHIPIIMLTAKASEQSKIEGLETQVDDYLTKPFSIRELALRIRNILAIRQKLREKYIRSITVSPSEITTNSVDEQFVSRILKVVEDNMADPEFSVETLCDLAGVSRATLHKKLKSLLDQSATEFINTIRVKRAAQLIKQKAGNISEIAYDVGFSNLSYFTKVFKKYNGVAPSEMIP